MASIWDTLFPNQDYRTAAPSGGYADLYANSLLGNRTDTPTSVGAMETGKDFIPVLSDVLAFGEAGHALSEGDRKTAAILAAGGLLGTIPGLGPTLARPVMAAGRKAADVASRIEVDPNAVGSLLGNVRVKPKSPAELPEPRNEAEAMAKQVLEMRAAGDAGDVTEDMMALADDTYMYKNTPIDMSEASRLSRSEDFNPDYFHGSNADIAGFDRSSRGTFLSSSPDVADSYVNRDGGQIYPVSVRGSSDFPRVEGGGSNFNRIPEAGLPEEFEYMKYDNNGRPFNTDFIVSQSSQEGSPGVLFSNIADKGPNVKTYLDETSDEAKARAARASMPSDVTNVRYPHNIRSRFARFDPEFKHLRNLSAGVGVAPIGLLALREEQKRANEEQYKRGLLQ